MRPLFKLLNVSITFDLITLHVDRKNFWQHRFPTWCGTSLLLVFVNEDSVVVYFISVWLWFKYICCCCFHNVLSICICIYYLVKPILENSFLGTSVRKSIKYGLWHRPHNVQSNMIQQHLQFLFNSIVWRTNIKKQKYH